MMRDPMRPVRRSIRLAGYDYRSEGAYFVTICTQDRACVFGAVESGEVVLTPPGRAVAEQWSVALPRRFPFVAIDAFVLMPNHLHSIVWIDRRQHYALSQIIGAFKSITSVEWTRRSGTDGWPTFRKRLWQRNYYERIIRDDGELQRTREYVDNNPMDWNDDEENPRRT